MRLSLSIFDSFFVFKSLLNACHVYVVNSIYFRGTDVCRMENFVIKDRGSDIVVVVVAPPRAGVDVFYTGSMFWRSSAVGNGEDEDRRMFGCGVASYWILQRFPLSRRPSPFLLLSSLPFLEDEGELSSSSKPGN